MDADTRTSIIQQTLAYLRDYYVFPDAATAMDERIHAHVCCGAYDSLSDPVQFCDAFTMHLQDVCHDKHLRVVFHGQAQLPRENDLYSDPAALAAYWAEAQLDNYGFHRAERLPGNIGYLRMHALDEAEETAETMTAALTFLMHTHALILDIRAHTGGASTGVAFLCSYFCDTTPVHLNDIYCRKDNSVQQFWTLPHLPGRRYLGKPLYILTSSRTPSAGEELAYNLQTLGRATIVGETTVGAANPVEVYQLNPHFDVRIPTCRAINPITRTNWEGTGVTPDIAVSQAEALHIAHREALKHVCTQLGQTPSDVTKALWEEATTTLKVLEEAANVA